MIYAESGGNPFFLEQLARSFRRRGGAAERTGGEGPLAGIEVPPAVSAALAEELAELDDEIRLLLQAAAVVGDPFEPELAAAAAATDEEAALGALDLLLARDLIRETDVPRRFRFRHPLVRRAVYDAAPTGWRLMAHQRCAEALATRGAPVAARARHVELSARHGDASAVAVLREAGEATAGSAPATAARWFEGALRLVSKDAPAEERVALLLAQARVPGGDRPIHREPCCTSRKHSTRARRGCRPADAPDQHSALSWSINSVGTTRHGCASRARLPDQTTSSHAKRSS